MYIRKFLAFSGIRSDYDLMSGLFIKINKDPAMQLGLIVSGTHLSESFGYTVKHIESDRIPIIARIESLLDSNSKSARIKSAAILLQNCLNYIEAFNPDAIIYSGDREDVMVGALSGAYLGIPTIHFFGGDHACDGNVDNAVRHAASKLSSLHFVSNEIHKERLLRMGESEQRIFVIGSPALDKFLNTPWIKKDELLKKINCIPWPDYALMIYHPVFGDDDKSGQYFEEILLALKKAKIPTLVGYPNSDSGTKHVLAIIQKYSGDNNFFFYKNLDRSDFVNLMRHALFMIGNSSAGLVEAPMIPLAAINVGTRQKGRLAADNIVFIDQDPESIEQAINTVLDENFQQRLEQVVSLYGCGDSVTKAHRLLKTLSFADYKYKSEDPCL